LRTFLALPLLGFTVVVQTAIISRMPLLQGTVDLVLLVLMAWALQEKANIWWQWSLIGGILVSYVSAMPSITLLVGYLIATAIARALQAQVWKTPILAMYATTFIGSILIHGLSIGALLFTGNLLQLQESIQLVLVPSLLLNMLAALPVYIVIKDLAGWLYPVEIQT
jgi:hypothetical protein